MTRKMHLGAFLYGTGHHLAGWRMPDAEHGGENTDLLIRSAQAAERGKFDMIFLADGLHSSPKQHPSMILRLEPLTLLSAIAMKTDKIGLAATASTTYWEPYHLARMFGSLDHISKGRAAWNIVTGAQADSAKNFNKGEHPSHEKRYAIGAEFVKVVKGLWDSWGDGAIVADKKTGVYADIEKMRPLRHSGQFFQVEGPLNLSRPPQGYPVLIQAGASEAGRDFAASVAEVLFTADIELDAAIAFAEDMRSRLKKVGRDPQSIKIMPGVCPIIGSTEQEALQKLEKLGEFSDPVSAIQLLSRNLGHDVSSFDLDGPLPDLPPSNVMQGYAVALTRMAKKRNMTIRQLRDYTGVGQGHFVLLGTPEQIADSLEAWFNAGAADGFNVMPPWIPSPFDEFVDHVVPILQSRGLFRTDYEGTTLRNHLGLQRAPHSKEYWQ